MRLKHIALAAIATSLLVLGLQTQAQERRPGGGPRPGGAPAPNWRFDDRFHHDRYYPAPGGYVGVLPGGSVSIGFGADNFFFNAGVWFRPAGGRFLIVEDFQIVRFEPLQKLRNDRSDVLRPGLRNDADCADHETPIDGGCGDAGRRQSDADHRSRR